MPIRTDSSGARSVNAPQHLRQAQWSMPIFVLAASAGGLHFFLRSPTPSFSLVTRPSHKLVAAAAFRLAGPSSGSTGAPPPLFTACTNQTLKSLATPFTGPKKSVSVHCNATTATSAIFQQTNWDGDRGGRGGGGLHYRLRPFHSLHFNRSISRQECAAMKTPKPPAVQMLVASIHSFFS